jgi:DNA-binding transcriptional LysR family regulator
MALQIDEIRAFAEVARTRSFSAAAESLGITRSGLSKAVARLEGSLKVQLLQRSTRRVSTTELGEQFLADSLRLLALSNQMEVDVQRRSKGTAGLLKVNVSTPLGRTTIIPALPRLFEKYPDLRLDIKFTDQPEDLIDTGRDIGVWFGELPDQRLKFRILAKTTRITCAAPSYLDRFGTPKTVTDLREHRCLATTGWAERLNWQFKKQPDFDRLHLAPFLQVNTAEALRAAALSGLGIAQGSSLLFNHNLLRSGRLVQILPVEVVPGDNISAVFPAARFQSPLTKIFLKFLVEVVGARAKPYPVEGALADGEQQ